MHRGAFSGYIGSLLPCNSERDVLRPSGSIPYADDPAKLTGNVKGIYSKSERLLKLMFLVDLLDAGVEGGRVVAVEAGKAEVGAVTGLEKALLGKEC